MTLAQLVQKHGEQVVADGFEQYLKAKERTKVQGKAWRQKNSALIAWAKMAQAKQATTGSHAVGKAVAM